MRTFVLVAFVLSSYSAFAAEIQQDLVKRFKSGAAELPILVQMKGRADIADQNLDQMERVERITLVRDQLRQVATDAQRNFVEFLKSKGLRYRAFYIVNAVAVWGVDYETVQQIATRQDVEKVSGNLPIKNVEPRVGGFDFKSLEPMGPGANIVRVGAPTVWAGKGGTRGEGIIVAGQDTGYAWTHPAFKDKYLGFDGTKANHDYHWHDAIHAPMTSGKNPCGYDSAEPCDDNGHGTHTMGTVLGDDGRGNQVGVAPGAKWIGCRNMDQGLGSPATYIECFEFFLAPYPRSGDSFADGDPSRAPHVINNSWGCPPEEGCQGDEIIQVIQNLHKAGIMVVVSAGNDGPGCETIQHPPASYAEAFRVGAFDHRNDTIASFSSRGPSTFDGSVGPDVSAPGVGIRSSVRTGGYEGTFWSGTSMAGPHAVGVVALLWSGFPTIVGKINETKVALRLSAEPKKSGEICGMTPGDQIPNNTYGYGLMNAARAFEWMQKAGY